VFTDAIRAIAHKEFSDKLKSRWVIVIALGFAVFTLIISYFGAAPAGVAGFQRFDATIASLTSLVIYFIPILALTLGGGVIADERDRHTLEIFMSSPITAGEFIFGKFAGLSISLALSTLLGFGASGILLLSKSGIGSLGSYMVFILHSLMLGIIFLSVSFLVSILFDDRTKVIAVTIFLWLFFTILYDLGLVGLLIVTKGGVGTGVFTSLLLLNPVDVYRILNFVSIGEFSIHLGLASVEFPSYMTGTFLWGVTLFWVLTPLLAGYLLFKKRYRA
jgi:Cu-processing system permease protein